MTRLPGARSNPARRRTFVIVLPSVRATSNRPGPRGGSSAARSSAAGQLLRPEAPLKSFVVLIGVTSGSSVGARPGPRRAYQGEAAGRVLEGERGRHRAPPRPG